MVLVVMGQHSPDDAPLLQESIEGVARVRKAAVDEDPMNEVGAHVHRREPTAPTREANAFNIVEALDFNHWTKVAGADTGVPCTAIRSAICGSVCRGVRCGEAPGLMVGRSILLYWTRHT